MLKLLRSLDCCCERVTTSFLRFAMLYAWAAVSAGLQQQLKEGGDQVCCFSMTTTMACCWPMYIVFEVLKPQPICFSAL
jgi:hypothetical protein